MIRMVKYAFLLIIPLLSIDLGHHFLTFASFPQQRAGERVIWQGNSGNFGIRWTNTDITVSSANAKQHFSLHAQLKEDYEKNGLQEIKFNEDDFCSEPNVEASTYTILSVVGSIISFSQNYCYVSGTINEGVFFSTTDLHRSLLRKSGEFGISHNIKLTDLFSEQDIFNALMKDKFILMGLKSSRVTAPINLVQLLKVFTNKPIKKDDCNYRIGDSLLTGFAFHHLEGDSVAVRINLLTDHGCNELQLGILLPIPAQLKDALGKAEMAREGFLMKDSRKISQQQITGFSFKQR